MSEVANAQWGYVGIGSCYDCNANSVELWVVSTATLQPRCAHCLVHDFKRYREAGLEDANISFYLDVNPLNSDIYGTREEWCRCCGNVVDKDASTVSAKDSRGETHEVHSSCASYCEECDDYYVSTHPTWSFRRVHDEVHWNYVSFHEQISGGDICSGCVDNLDYLSCQACSQVGEPDYYQSYCGEYYCDDCYNNNVYTCDECNEEYWDGDGHDCEEGVIHQWDYKPNPDFFSCSNESPTYYLGLELEVENTEGKVRTYNMAESIQEKFLKDHAYIKHDGSISEGFEIVTHPHTLESMRTQFNWDVLGVLRGSGFRSWNAADSSCGIHVHVSRTAFGGSQRSRVADHKRDAHLLRFMKLIYDNQRQVERLAGRSGSRWATFDDKGGLVNKVKYGQQNSGRYSAINTENYNTIEVRVFKGSLKYERVMSALELVTACVEYTRELKVTSSNGALSWPKFISYVAQHEETYPNLLAKISDSLANDSVNN